ncbi:unnamed protein product [Brassica rapa subsp. trilocularis]
MAPDESSSRTWRLQERKAMAYIQGLVYFLHDINIEENMEVQWDVSEDHDQYSFLGLGFSPVFSPVFTKHVFFRFDIEDGGSKREKQWGMALIYLSYGWLLIYTVFSMTFPFFILDYSVSTGLIDEKGFPLWMEMMMVEVSKEKISRLLLGLFMYILPCLAVSNFYIVVSSRMNLELPIIACASEVDLRALQWLPQGAVFINQFTLVVHPFKLKVDQQMGKLSTLLIKPLKGRFSGLLSLTSSNEEGSRWFLKLVFLEASLIFGNTLTSWHMNLAFVRIWSEVCPSDCEGTSQSFAHQTRDCSSNGEVWGMGL